MDPILDSCDESKCVSRGLDYLFNSSFTCYGDKDSYFPMACSDGFLPKLVEDEPSFIHTDSSVGPTPVSYFTCCPPLSTSTNPTRHCSDPIYRDSVRFVGLDLDSDEDFHDENDAICENQDTRKYPRKLNPFVRTKLSRKNVFLSTGPVMTEKHYAVCCDEPLPMTATNITMNFLEYSDCVPYRNEFHELGLQHTVFGRFRVATCDFPNADFTIPRPMGEDHDVTGMYKCCKTGESLPPFLHNSNFKMTLYPLLALQCIAAIISVIVVLALLIPLLMQLKQGTYHMTTAQRKRKGGPPQYSTFNLYLVYLSLLDLTYLLIEISVNVDILNQKFNPYFHGNNVFSSEITMSSLTPKLPFIYPYWHANIWINAIITYQVLDLLKSSKNARRIRQPSLTRVHVQVGVVYMVAALESCIIYVLWHQSFFRARNRGDFETFQMLSFVPGYIQSVLIYPAILYVIVVTVVIWCRGYIPSWTGTTPNERAMRQLFFYFFRIVLVWFAVWIPVYLLLFLAVMLRGEAWAFFVIHALLALQPTLTFGMILTKADARKYVVDLITLSCLKRQNNNKATKERVAPPGPVRSEKQSPKKPLADRRGLSSAVPTDSLSATGASNTDATARIGDNYYASANIEVAESDSEEEDASGRIGGENYASADFEVILSDSDENNIEDDDISGSDIQDKDYGADYYYIDDSDKEDNADINDDTAGVARRNIYAKKKVRKTGMTVLGTGETVSMGTRAAGV